MKKILIATGLSGLLIALPPSFGNAMTHHKDWPYKTYSNGAEHVIEIDGQMNLKGRLDGIPFTVICYKRISNASAEERWIPYIKWSVVSNVKIKKDYEETFKTFYGLLGIYASEQCKNKMGDI